MDRRVLYVQPGKEAAEAVRERLKNENVEFIVSKTAKEAFEIMNETEVMVVLLDCHIPDMKLFEFVKMSIKSFPETRLNICVDAIDAQLVTNIANIKQVKKIYMEPWDVNEMAEGIVSTLDQLCIDNDFMKRQQVLLEEKEQFEATLNSLKGALIKQRHSYHKLDKVLKPYIESMVMLSERTGNEAPEDKTDTSAGANSEERELLYNFVKYSCEKILRIMTTAKLDVEGLSDNIKENMQTAVPKSGRIRIGNVASAVIGSADRDKLALLVYCMWVLTIYQSYRLKSGDVEIDSYYMGESNYRFDYNVSGEENSACPESIHRYVENILKLNCSEFTYDTEGNMVKYHLDFQIK